MTSQKWGSDIFYINRIVYTPSGETERENENERGLIFCTIWRKQDGRKKKYAKIENSRPYREELIERIATKNIHKLKIYIYVYN